MNHLLLKLVDGSDVICRVMELEETHIKVDNPMKVVYNIEGPTGQTAMLTKYAYFSEQIVFDFRREHIVQVLEPKEDMVQWYENVLQTIQERDNTLIVEDDIDEREQEYMETLLERFAIANNQLH